MTGCGSITIGSGDDPPGDDPDPTPPGDDPDPPDDPFPVSITGCEVEPSEVSVGDEVLITLELTNGGDRSQEVVVSGNIGGRWVITDTRPVSPGTGSVQYAWRADDPPTVGAPMEVFFEIDPAP